MKGWVIRVRLCYWLALYQNHINTLLYGRKTLFLEEIKSAIGINKLKDNQDNPKSESSEGLMARGRPKTNKGKK